MKTDEFNHIDKPTPFIIPNGYIDNLQERIIANCHKESSKPAVSFWRSKWIKYSCAATIACLMAVTILVKLIDPIIQSNRETEALDEIGYSFAQLTDYDQEIYLELVSEDILLTQLH